MAEHQQTKAKAKAQITTNGIQPDMSEEDLLTELTRDTVGLSWGYVRLKFTHGDKESYKRVKVQPVDPIRIHQAYEQMPKETVQQVLDSTAATRSIGFTDENWIQTLTTVVWGLAAPMKLTDPTSNEVVWVAGGEPQDLPRALMALSAIGLDFWHINDISNTVMRLTRDLSDEQALGNSS